MQIVDMPDLTTHSFYHCKNSRKVGPLLFRVQKEKNILLALGLTDDLYISMISVALVRLLNLGKGYCKHIQKVIESGSCCRWQQFCDGGEPVEVDGEKRCPNCNGPVSTSLHGV